MAKQDLGKKRRCASCGMKFYDFNKTKIVCPSCQTVFNPDQLLKSRRGRAAKAEPAAAAVEALEEGDILADDDDEDDADGLGGDEALVNIAPTESNDDEDDAAILDDNVDEDFIDEIDEDGDVGEGDEDEA